MQTPIQQAIIREQSDMADYEAKLTTTGSVDKKVCYKLLSERCRKNIEFLQSLLPTEQQIIEDAFKAGHKNPFSENHAKDATRYFTITFQQ